MEEDSWTDSEEEYEEERDVSPWPEMDQGFVNNVVQVKHSLYENTVLSPELGTNDAQDDKVLQDYLNQLNRVYVMSIQAQNGKTFSKESLRMFPKETQDVLYQTLTWIADFFGRNQLSKTIPYADYLRKSFHDYQFVQKKSFEYE